MPIYDYLCKVCGVEVQVIRTITEFDQAPLAEEVQKCDCPHEWVRQIKGKVGVAATDAFRRHGMKGHWR